MGGGAAGRSRTQGINYSAEVLVFLFPRTPASVLTSSSVSSTCESLLHPEIFVVFLFLCSCMCSFGLSSLRDSREHQGFTQSSVHLNWKNKENPCLDNSSTSGVLLWWNGTIHFLVNALSFNLWQHHTLVFWVFCQRGTFYSFSLSTGDFCDSWRPLLNGEKRKKRFALCSLETFY